MGEGVHHPLGTRRASRGLGKAIYKGNNARMGISQGRKQYEGDY